MEPPVQYAKTSDGVSIAYCVVGDGPTTVVRVPAIPWSHVQYEWEKFPYLLVTKPLVDRCRTVWYDSRGSGLSDRHSLDFSIDALVRDLEAVLDKVGAETYGLCAMWDGVPAAVAYAAAQPGRVSGLVLVEGYTKGSDYLESGAGQVELGIRDKDWIIYTEMLARLVWGYDDPVMGRQIAQHFRACAEPQTLRAIYDIVNAEWDITELAPAVAAATLVINNQNLSWLPVRAGQRLAASIPNSRFVVIDDLMYRTVPALIAAFLDMPHGVEPGETLPSGTAIILFADIAGSTALTEQLGDHAFRDRARTLDKVLRALIRDAGGTPIDGKLLGDGVLAAFSSAAQAINAARRCAGAGDEGRLPLHLGIHAGDVIRENDNIFGGAVNIAARIAAASAPGEIFVSRTVRDLARTSAGVEFTDIGVHELKGIDEPQQLFTVRAR